MCKNKSAPWRPHITTDRIQLANIKTTDIDQPQQCFNVKSPPVNAVAVGRLYYLQRSEKHPAGKSGLKVFQQNIAF